MCLKRFRIDFEYFGKERDEYLAGLATETMKADVPRGLLHGDPFLDNLLAKDTGEVVGWVDWEDVAIGPLMFDVGCAIIGCCYRSMEGEDNLLDTSRLTAFLGPLQLMSLLVS